MPPVFSGAFEMGLKYFCSSEVVLVIHIENYIVHQPHFRASSHQFRRPQFLEKNLGEIKNSPSREQNPRMYVVSYKALEAETKTPVINAKM